MFWGRRLNRFRYSGNRNASNVDHLNPFFHNVKVIVESRTDLRHHTGLRSTCNEIQVSIQYIASLLNEYDTKSRQVFLATFSVIALQQEFDRCIIDLSAVKEKVDQYHELLQKAETKNVRAFEALRDMSKKLFHYREENFLITNETKQSIQLALNRCREIWASNDQTTEATRIADILAHQQENIHDDMRQRIEKLEYHHSISREVVNLHLAFSSTLIDMNFEKKVKKSIFNPKKLSIISNMHYKSNFNYLIVKLGDLGSRLLAEVENLQTAAETIIKRQDLIKHEIEIRKQCMYHILMQLQKIISEVNILNEKHDALIGKLVKSRPIYGALEKSFMKDMESRDRGTKTETEMETHNFLSLLRREFEQGPDGKCENSTNNATVKETFPQLSHGSSNSNIDASSLLRNLITALQNQNMQRTSNLSLPCENPLPYVMNNFAINEVCSPVMPADNTTDDVSDLK